MQFPAFRYAPLFVLAMTLSCATPAPPPLSQPAPPPAVVQAPPPPPAADWTQWPVAPGDWHYRAVAGGSVALFGASGNDGMLSIRCELAGRRILVARAITGQPGGTMGIRTSFGAWEWPVQGSAEPAPATSYAITVRVAQDPDLDRMAASRGRFAVEMSGTEPLVVPNWAEVSRVIEDCRG